MGLLAQVAALLGISAFASSTPALAALPEGDSDRLREAFGGNIVPLPQTRTRWYLADVERAEVDADAGRLAEAAQLMRYARRDGVVSGLLSTCTDGLVRLPKAFRGPTDIVSDLESGHDEARSVFDEMCPPSELAQLAADGRLLGVGVAELVPVQGRDYPVLVRLPPEHLVYMWRESRWYYRSIMGLLPITPGDGRWVLHVPGGRQSPWQGGVWRAVGRAAVRKEHAQLHKDNWEAKLANPARVAIAPQGASQEQKEGWFRRVMAWGVNTVFGMTPGYDVKLLESNGRGHESFDKTIADQSSEIMICLAGQTVTTDGGTGFANADIHKSIRADIIKAIADGLAFTINTQVLPAFVLTRYGEERLAQCPVVEWDVTPPKDRNAEASALVSVASAIAQLTDALARHGLELDAAALCGRFGVPTTGRRPRLEVVEGGANDAPAQARRAA